jgi:hypothetical protein
MEGKFSRPNGPVIEYTRSYRTWHQDGKINRLDGAAIEYANGRRAWLINGEEYTEEEFNALKDLNQELLCSDCSCEAMLQPCEACPNSSAQRKS